MVSNKKNGNIFCTKEEKSCKNREKCNKGLNLSLRRVSKGIYI